MGTSNRPERFAEQIRRDREALAEALATIELFNARLAAGRTAWLWPTIGAALVTKHHWLVIACDSCDTMIEMDLTVKRRDPLAPVSIALKDAQCPRCNGSGRTRIAKLAKFASCSA